MDIKKILDAHKLWHETGGEGGVMANLRGADLESANLSGTFLDGGDLSDANIYRADLRGANLRGVDLSGANLEDAFLDGAVLSEAKDILQWQAPQGEKRTCYSVKHDDFVMHKLGCFWGITEEAVEAIRKKYGEGSLYEKFLLMQAEALGGE